MVTPDAEVPYEGKTLEPICSKGTPWVFFVKRGTVNKTLMYYQGGGACWDYTSCNLPTHKTSTGPGDNPAGASTGFADLSNPDNRFCDWNAVFVSLLHRRIGALVNAVVDHRSANGNQGVTIHHKGYVNAQVAEKWAREHFVNPDAVFVTGSSAGAYGAIVNAFAPGERLAVVALRCSRRRRQRRHHPGLPGERHRQWERRAESARLDPGTERSAHGTQRGGSGGPSRRP